MPPRPHKYAGCSRPQNMEPAFNELAYLAGLSRDLAFENIDRVVAAMATAPAVVPPACCAVVLVLAGGAPEEQPSPGPGPSGSAADGAYGADGADGADAGIVTFLPELRHIPDIYAFLHAVLNAGIDDAVEPDGALGELFGRCRGLPQAKRDSLLRKAERLQKAYKEAVTDGVWRGQGPALGGAVSSEPAPAAAAAAAAATAAAAAAAAPRFYVFVQSPTTGAAFLIDRGALVALPPPRTPPVHGVHGGLLTDAVGDKIAALRDAAGRDAESAVLGLMVHAC